MLIERYNEVKKHVEEACKRVGRDPREVTVIAVSKTKPLEMVEELRKEKVLDFFGLTSGEDNSQEEILIEENMPKNVSSSYPSTGSFLTDIDFLSTNENSVRLLSACHSDWNKDLSWFIDAHKSNSTFEHYKNKPQDNETVIRQFVNLKKGRYKRMEDFLRRIYKL